MAQTGGVHQISQAAGADRRQSEIAGGLSQKINQAIQSSVSTDKNGKMSIEADQALMKLEVLKIGASDKDQKQIHATMLKVQDVSNAAGKIPIQGDALQSFSKLGAGVDDGVVGTGHKELSVNDGNSSSPFSGSNPFAPKVPTAADLLSTRVQPVQIPVSVDGMSNPILSGGQG